MQSEVREVQTLVVCLVPGDRSRWCYQRADLIAKLGPGGGAASEAPRRTVGENPGHRHLLQ